MLDALLIIWAVWCLGHLLGMALTSIFPVQMPSYTGFRVVMPPYDPQSKLTREEWQALYMHERGHAHHWHAWKNFLRVCVFMRPRKAIREAQELEADLYAAEMGHAVHLSSALCKLAVARFDVYRAARLLKLVGFEVTPTGCRQPERLG